MQLWIVLMLLYLDILAELWYNFSTFVITNNWGRLGFDRVELSMLACSALYGEHLKENVHTIIGENNYALAA